jgi:hypothetical protein
MREGGLSRLNGAALNLKTGKHTKIRVAELLKILRICRSGRSGMLVKPDCTNFGCIRSNFYGVWLIQGIAGFC